MVFWLYIWLLKTIMCNYLSKQGIKVTKHLKNYEIKDFSTYKIDTKIWSHLCEQGVNSPVLKSMLIFKQSRAHGRCGHQRSISISGVPPEAVQVFIRFLYSSRYNHSPSTSFVCVGSLSHAYLASKILTIFLGGHM